MGWFWGSQSTPVDTLTSQTLSPACSPPKKEDHSPPSEPQFNSSRDADRHTPTRDELAESELRSILEELEADTEHSSTKYILTRQQRTVPHKFIASPSKLTLEDELLPTEMSCRQAFDAAFYCQSLGGQFNNLYRYGGIRSCSQHWKDFWFCMRIKSYTTEEKKAMIRTHHKKKILKYKLGPSSEDVWESRDKKLEWGEAFSEPAVVFTGSDEEWNRLERIRREARGERNP